MLHACLDLSRERLDFCSLDEGGEGVEAGVAPPDADGLPGLVDRVRERYPAASAKGVLANPGPSDLSHSRGGGQLICRPKRR